MKLFVYLIQIYIYIYNFKTKLFSKINIIYECFKNKYSILSFSISKNNVIVIHNFINHKITKILLF